MPNGIDRNQILKNHIPFFHLDPEKSHFPIRLFLHLDVFFTIRYFNVLTRNQILLHVFQNSSYVFSLKNAEPIHKFDKVIKHHILQSTKASTLTVWPFFCLQANENKCMSPPYFSFTSTKPYF